MKTTVGFVASNALPAEGLAELKISKHPNSLSA
jgi:hypothetical protein